MRNERPVVFLESYAPVPILVAFREIWNAETIFVYREFPPASHLTVRRPASDRFGRLLLRVLNRRAILREMEPARLNASALRASWDTVATVDSWERRLGASLPCAVVADLLGDVNVIKYFKYLLARGWTPNKLAYVRVAMELAASGSPVICVPSAWHALMPNQDLPVPARVARRLRALARLKACIETVILLMFPLLYLARELVRGRIVLLEPERIRRDVLQSVVWGLTPDTFSGGVRMDMSDALWLGGQMRERAVFVFNRGRRYPVDLKSRCEAAMHEVGVPYVDGASLQLTPRLCRTLIAWQRRVVSAAWRRRSMPVTDSILLTIGYNALYHAFEKLRELAWVDHQIEFCLNDGADAHIVRTIVSNARGIRTIGVQHNSNAGPYVWPQLCYVHFNTYCVYSDAHIALHAPHWSRLRLVKTGRVQVDRLTAIQRDADRYRALQQQLIDRCGRRRYLAVVALPSPGSRNLESQWDEMYRGLQSVLETDLDCTVWLRFRDMDHLRVPHIGRLMNLTSDARVVADQTTFSTGELMVLSDLFVSNSHSSGLLEAVAIRKHAFTFDFVGTGAACFTRYGSDLVLSTADDVRKAFRSLVDPSVAADCDRDRLRREYCYTGPGSNIDRIRGAINALLEDLPDPRDARGTVATSALASVDREVG